LSPRSVAIRLNTTSRVGSGPGLRPGGRLRQDTARAVGGALSVGWLVGVLAADLTWRSPTFSLGVLYPLSALVACAVLTPLVTAALAAGSLGLALGSAAWNHDWGTREQTIRLIDVLLVSIGAIVIAVVRARREQRFLRMAAIADAAQRAVLPTLPGRVGSISVAARYMSAAEDALVGGDLYDWYAFGELSRFIVGDVRGKGVAAAEQAARVIRAFRQAAARAPTLAEVARDMNAYLEPFLEEEEFVTALLVDATNSNRLTMISCGHPAPLLVRAEGNGGEVDLPPGLPLGLGGDYRPGVVEWRPGDRVLLYTDGLTEARAGEQLFGEDRVAGILRRDPGEDVTTLCKTLLEAARDFAAEPMTDDVAILAIRRV